MPFSLKEVELFDQEQKVFLDKQKIKEQVDRIYLHLSTKLGSGKTAEVVFVPEHDGQICYKIISEKRYLELYGDVLDAPNFNSPKVESYFLSKAREVGKEVNVPKPICYWEGESDSLGRFKVLVMERLNAFTIQDVLYGIETLGEDFDLDIFGATLRDFIHRMNEDAGVIHRDITVTNVMIERGTNMPCIIDFGDSEKIFRDEKTSTKDKIAIKDVISALKNHLSNFRANRPSIDNN